MARAVEFLTTHRVAGLPLQPGGRKTSITLAAFCKLREQHKVSTMLVIAPLRVVRQTWPAEVLKWSQFRHLRVAILHGSKKDQALETDADLYLINPEGIDWLAKKFMGRTLPFDILCIDELTKFKNASATRHKALRPRAANMPYHWGLTGTLKPNSHMDLFGQQLILDGGEALGRYITKYRDNYFIKGFNGFDYDLMLGAEKKIAERLAKTWFYMDPADYSQLPPLIDNPILLTMAAPELKAYKQMKNIMIAALPKGGLVTAEAAGAAYAKMAQMANGAVYKDDSREFHRIHDLKLDALEELIEELDGQPLLVGYEFNHDLTRIRERLAPRLPGGVLPYLGKGTTKAQETQWIADWNANRLPVLCAHPASAGHGLNLQEGMAKHVCWFSVPWDWELYDQFIRRIRRSGNEAERIFNHRLVVQGTIDEVKFSDKTEKGNDHARLMAILNSEILRDPAQARTVNPTTGDDPMADPLSRPGQGAMTMPPGWGGPAGAPPAQPPQQPAQGGWGPPPSQAPAPNTVHQAPPAQAPAGWGAPPAQAPAGWGTPPPATPQRPADPSHIAMGPEGEMWWNGVAWVLAPTAPPQAPTQREAMGAMLTTGQPPAGFDPRVGQMVEQIANGDYGDPAPQQQAPAGWGAPPAQPPQDTGWQLPPGQPVAAHLPINAPAPQRVRGQPSPGKARRSKTEMDEDTAWAAANPGTPLTAAPPVEAAPAPLLLTPATPAPAEVYAMPAATEVHNVSAVANGADRTYQRLRVLEMLVNGKIEFANVQALLGAAESLATFVES